MLVKLRISNEQDWLNGGYNTNYSYSEQYSEIYSQFTSKHKEGNIPTVLTSGCSIESICLFDFNGYDSKTNTFFYTFATTAG